MKTYKLNPVLKLSSLFMLLVTAFAFTSCDKNDNDDDGVMGTARVRVVNSVKGSGDVNLFLDDSKVTSSAVAYGEASNYVETNAGNRKAEFRAFGDVKTNFDMSIENGKHYTIFYTGSASTGGYVKTEDDRTAPPAGKAKVRVVHLSSAAASTVDLGITATSKLINNLAYKAVSAYQTVDANTTFFLFTSGSSSVALTMPTTVQVGKIYTIYVTGATSADVTYKVIAEN